MNCRKCGKKLENNINDCSSCGKVFINNTQNSEISTSNTYQSNNLKPPQMPDGGFSKAGCLGLIIGCTLSLIVLTVDSVQDKIFEFFYYDLGVSSGMWKFIAILLIILPPIIVPIICLIINVLLGMTIYKSKWEKETNDYKEKLDKYNEEKMRQDQQERENTEQYIKENEIPSNTMTINCLRSTLLGIGNTKRLYTWVKEDKIYFAGIHYSMGIEKLEIPKKNITCFLRQGDAYNELKISGGKVEGGGSSLVGAAVGGVIAGGTGAVIGSRKKIQGEEIRSENVRIDKRETILEFLYEDRYEHLFFDSDTYDILLKLIPEKEIQFVNQRNTVVVEEEKEFYINYDFIMEQIKKLSDLKEQGILTEEEFKEKKKILLEKIS